MIMQEYQPKQRNFSKISNFQDFNEISEISISKQFLKNSESNLREIPIVAVEEKKQIPFPYLKRKSIRVDLVLKKEKMVQKKKNEQKLLESLRREKKVLESENCTLKGRIMQMEYILQQLKSSTNTQCRNQHSQTNCSTLANKDSNKKINSMVKCTKCNMCLTSKYSKYHARICGNTKLDRLLSEKDLKTLQTIRKSQKSSIQSIAKPPNNWRRKNEEFLSQIKKAQNKRPNCCLIFSNPAYKKISVNQ